MKLLVIVLCLLSERFLVHASSHNRFHWFSTYCNNMQQGLSKKLSLSNPWLVFIMILLPLLLAASLVFCFFGDFLFGFVGLLLNIVIFYYCIGPGNPFYPVHTQAAEQNNSDAGGYLAQVNGQLFAVVFWYIATGPLGLLVYRMVSLCQKQALVSQQASWLTGLLDWLPARMTSLLYLLVGNFQSGLQHFSRLFFTSPENNYTMLTVCGLHAARHDEQEQVPLPQAERLVEHAIIVFLVLIALFTMVAWL